MDKAYRLYHWRGMKSFDFFKDSESISSYVLIDVEEIVREGKEFPAISNIPVLVPHNPRRNREVGAKNICRFLFKRFSEVEVYGDSLSDGEIDFEERGQGREQGQGDDKKSEMKKFLKKEEEKKDGFGSMVGGGKKMFTTGNVREDEDGGGTEQKPDVVIDPINIASLLVKKPKKKPGSGLIL